MAAAQFQNLDSMEGNDEPHPGKQSPLHLQNDSRRSGLSSRSREELEDFVRRKFLLSKANRHLAEDKTLHFTPLTLDYNEISVEALATWATGGDLEKQKASDDTSIHTRSKDHQKPVDRRTVASMFRKCQVCGGYGHYEVECDKMTDSETLEFSHLAKVHGNVHELREETKKMKRPYPTVPSATCEVCSSQLGADRMLLCDGCEKYYHTFCITPSLKQVPRGEWFCTKCSEFNHDISSDVEVEACEGFVIEQRKRRRNPGASKQNVLNSWQMAVAVVDENTAQAEDEFVGRSSRFVEESVEIGGFVVHAKPLESHQGRLPKPLEGGSEPDQPLSRQLLAPGAIVAWFPAGVGSESSEALVGHVLAVDSNERKALVRRMDGWRDILSSEARSSLEDCVIHIVPAGATLWYPADELHIMARAPSKMTNDDFSKEILPARFRMKEKRQSSKRRKKIVPLSLD